MSNDGQPPSSPAAAQPSNAAAAFAAVNEIALDFQRATSDDWRRCLLRKKSGELIDCRENVYHMLNQHPDLRGLAALDEFSNRIVKRRVSPIGNSTGEWEAGDDLRLGLWFTQQQDRLLVRSETTLRGGVMLAAIECRYHPVRTWLKNLIWDRIPRLDHWVVDFLGVRDSEYARRVGRYWLIAMVARVMQPGCDFKYMPILEGVQDQGKSRALHSLAGEWFADSSFDMRDKDAFQVLRGKWLYELSELDAMSRAESTRVKAFIGSPIDNYRASYDSRNRDWPRQLVFVGSTNPQDEYFKDTSGNVRYWPLRVEEQVQVEAIAAVREQLFAEALVAVNAEQPYYPTREESKALFEPEQAARLEVDPWADLISYFLVGETETTMTRLLCDGLKLQPHQQLKSYHRRVSIILQHLGWHRSQTGQDRTRVWRRSEPDALAQGSRVVRLKKQ